MKSPRKRAFQVLLAGLLMLSGCSSPQSPDLPAPGSWDRTQPTVANPELPPKAPDKEGPRLLTVSLNEEGKSGEVYLLPIPVTLRAWLEGAEGLVEWRIIGKDGVYFQGLLPTEVSPGEWVVEWGNPVPPPPSPVWLELWVEVAPDVPDSPEFVNKFGRRFAVVSRVQVKSAW